MQAQKSAGLVLFAIVGWAVSIAATTAQGAIVYVLGADSPKNSALLTQLTDLGHTVTSGGPLASYAGYDQVWDLRFDTPLTSADHDAMSSYMAAGGRMFLAGEDGTYVTRNNSVLGFVDDLGAGQVTLTGTIDGEDSQFITAQGQVVNFPNLSQTTVNFEQTTIARPAADSGFLVTMSLADPSSGSMLGWDMGEIDGAQDARLLVGFDVDVFGATGEAWTENMTTFLGQAVPEPPTVALFLSGLLVAGTRRRRHHLAH